MFQFRWFPLHTYVFSIRLSGIPLIEFPHSDTCGSKLICSSPQLFAAYRVLLRLLMPRHSPCTLSSLNFMSYRKSFFRSKCLVLNFCFTLSYQFLDLPLCYVVVIVTLMFPWNFNITRFAFSPFVFYSVFNVQFLTIPRLGGLKWARTTDLALIRRAL